MKKRAKKIVHTLLYGAVFVFVAHVASVLSFWDTSGRHTSIPPLVPPQAHADTPHAGQDSGPGCGACDDAGCSGGGG